MKPNLQIDPDRHRLVRGAIAAICLAGVALVCQAAWMDTKALLAQVLLERAWSRSQEGIEIPKPWPWADTFPIVRLRLVDQDRSMIVLAGASGRTLAFGPGHVDGTPLPGEPGNAVIVGHRDTHFSALRSVRVGDEIEIETRNGGQFLYRVIHTLVTDEHDTSHLRYVGDRLTLITCYPFDAVRPGGPLRWIVVAERVTATAASLASSDQRRLRSTTR